MNVTIIGTGAFGLSLALMFHENQNHITMWTKFKEEKKSLIENHMHSLVLPKIAIPEDIIITTDMEKAMEKADLVVLAIPVEVFRSVCEEMQKYHKKSQHFLIASKGIEKDTSSFLHEIVKDTVHTDKIAVISGPTFAIDMAQKFPVGLSLGVQNEETERIIYKTLPNSSLKLRTSKDIIGIEFCAAVKNVFALAAGFLDGMNMPISTKAMFITDALYDIEKNIEKIDGKKDTITSYAGLGDLLLTCISDKSRNFCFGKLIASSKRKEDVKDYYENHTIEGLYTLKALKTFFKKKDVSIPSISLIEKMVEDDFDKEEFLRFLIQK